MNQPSSVNECQNIIDVCLLAGKIMLQSGGETYRVEDTMMLIAASFGMPKSHSFVTPTGIFFAVEGAQAATRLIRISERSTDLKKVTLVNAISRRIAVGELSVAEAYKQLSELDSSSVAYPMKYQLAAAAIASGCFLILLNGSGLGVISAAISGCTGFIVMIYLGRFIPIRFFSEFFAALVVGMLSYGFVKLGIGQHLDKIMISSLVPLTPGLLITNAVRDLMAGHLLAGISKGAEAFLTAFAIGAGIAIVFSFFT